MVVRKNSKCNGKTGHFGHSLFLLHYGPYNFRSHNPSCFFFLQSGLCSSSELETSRGSIRIQHLTATSNTVNGSLKSNSTTCKTEQSRFPRLEECAHFHYDFTDIGPLVVRSEKKEWIYILMNSETKVYYYFELKFNLKIYLQGLLVSFFLVFYVSVHSVENRFILADVEDCMWVIPDVLC